MQCTARHLVLALGAILVMLLNAEATEARMRRALPIPIRMVTYIGEKLEGIEPEFSWLVTCRGKHYQLYVLKLDVLSGNLTPLDIDAAVALYKIKFQVVGEKTALERFTAVAPRQQVVIMGYARLDPAGRYLMLDRVEAPSIATPSPAR